MDWLRLYTDVLDSPKCQRLSGDTFKFWANLLCLARLDNGNLPPVEDIAFRVRCPEDQARQHIETLVAARLLDRIGKGLRPHNWDKRQYDSDSSTERSRKSRERKAQQEMQRCMQQDGTLLQRPRIEEKRLEENRKPLSPAVAGAEIATKRPLKSWYDSEHDRWYKAFWNRQGKAQSRKAYEKAINRLHDRDHLLYKAAMAYLDKMAVDDRARYDGTQDWEWRVKIHPASWLNQERWTDEPSMEVVPRRRMSVAEELLEKIKREEEQSNVG